MKYFLYARKSSESEDRQMASIDDQVAEMKRLAIEKGLNIIDVVSESKSAKRPGRPAFSNLIKRIEKGEAEGIVCWKLNRLSRNPVDGGQISWLLQQNIIKHIQTFGGSYYPSDNVLMMQVEFGMANQFIKDLKVDIERGIKKKLERGWYPTKPPVGYLAVSSKLRSLNDSEVIAHPINFEIVKHLWDMMLTGAYSVIDIKRHGDKLGLLNKKGVYYSKNAYHALFSNEFYTGCFHWTPFNGIRTRYEGKHPAMVSPFEFQKVQQILKKSFKLANRLHSFPYRGLITCGECQGTVTAELKHQVICTQCKWKYSILHSELCPRCHTAVSQMKSPSIIRKIYYHCTKKKGPCSQGSITQESIEESVIKELDKIFISKEFVIWGISVLKNHPESEKNSKVLVALKKRKASLETRLSGLIRMRAQGEITETEFQKSRAYELADLATIEKEISLESNLEKHLEIQLNESFNFAQHALSCFIEGDKSIRREILCQLGSNLTLHSKKLSISTDKVYSCIRDCEAVYKSKYSSLEPENDIEEYSLNDFFYPYCPVLCSKLTAIRTCLIDKIRKKLESESDEPS